MKTLADPVLIARGLRFAEGINFDRTGTLYCVDLEGGSVWRMPPGGALQEWLSTGGRPNGSRFGPGGDLFVADRGRRAILRLSTTAGSIAVYADRWEGQELSGPNDLCFGPDGLLYFTDPEGSSLSRRTGAVYAVAADGSVTRLLSGLAYPNGIVVTPDGTTLIVAETATGILRRYTLVAGAAVAELAPLVVLPGDGAGPDGMAFGADSLLYVADYGRGFIHAVAPDGEIVASMPGGGPTPTNVAFWEDSLYVTEGTSGSLYRFDIGTSEQRPFMRPW